MTEQNHEQEIDVDTLEKKSLSDGILQSLGSEGVQAILQSFGIGGDSVCLIKTLISQSQIPEGQKQLLDKLLDSADATEEGYVIDGEAACEDYDYFDDDSVADSTGGNSNVYDLRGIRQELEDLRKVNDTLAAALGACAVCWGGNPNCEACEGEGHAGAYDPQPRMFNELVVPAVQRARSLKRTRQKRPVRQRR